MADNNLRSLSAKEPISDEELEQVSGGVGYIQCRSCGNYIPMGTSVCPKCGQKP